MSLKLPKKKESTSGITALIDGDILKYSIGYAAQKEGKVDTIENCLHSVKVVLNRILEDTNAQFYKVYLSGGDNFRYELATILPYKGTRSKDKPFHYDNIVEYLINTWDAEVINGYEADDALTLEAGRLNKRGKDWVIATRDKDLLQFPGKHYKF